MDIAKKKKTAKFYVCGTPSEPGEKFIIHLRHPYCLFKIINNAKLELVEVFLLEDGEDDVKIAKEIVHISNRAEKWYYYNYVKNYLR